MRAQCPNRWTSSSARVRVPTRSAAERGSIANVSGSMSANTGVAPTRATASAVAANVNAGTITSSPGPTSSARSARTSASVPLAQPIACAPPR